MLTLATSTNEFPWAQLTPLLLAFVVGAVLLFAGRRVMRLAFTGVGLLVGAMIGWIVAHSVDLAVADWMVVLIPAVILAVLAAIGYKLTIAAVMAVVLGVAAPLAIVTASDVGLIDLPTATGEEATVDDETDADGDLPADDESTDTGLPIDLADWIENVLKDQVSDAASNSASKLLGEGEESDAETSNDGDDADVANQLTMSPEAEEHINRAKEFAREIYTNARSRWDALAPAARNTLMLSAAVAAFLGLLLGAIAPQVSASVASAGAGSAICLFTASLIAARLGAAENDWLPRSAGAWLLLWFVLAIIGLAIQWTIRPKPVDNSRE